RSLGGRPSRQVHAGSGRLGPALRMMTMEISMSCPLAIRITLASGLVLSLAACHGGSNSRSAPPSGSPSAVGPSPGPVAPPAPKATPGQPSTQPSPTPGPGPGPSPSPPPPGSTSSNWLYVGYGFQNMFIRSYHLDPTTGMPSAPKDVQLPSS